MPAEYKFFIRMFMATFCAWAIPHIAYRVIQLQLGQISVTFGINSMFLLAFGLALVSGFGVGLQVSLLQWMALRPYIQSTWRWLVGLVVAWSLGDVINMGLLIFIRKLFPGWGHEQYVLLRIVFHGLAIGIPVGLIQQALLQKRSNIRIWWALVAPLSIIGAILLDRGNLTIREGFAIIDPIYASLLAGLWMATLASLPTLLLQPVEKAEPNIPVAENLDLPDSVSAKPLDH
ncbi:MAG: hypothetical protein L6461_17605 [Anaerolineae bacterium]|nr:hypothetical protein [Anaerolineae bacterium]